MTRLPDLRKPSRTDARGDCTGRRCVQRSRTPADWVTVLLAVTLLNACATTRQSQLEQGRLAYGEGHYESAITILDPLATEGDELAAYWTGRSYEALALAGDANRLNDAARWYREAAEKGHDDARYRLGRLLYFSGEQRDTGIYLLQSAATCGHVEAGRLLRQEELPPPPQRCMRSQGPSSGTGPRSAPRTTVSRN